MQEGEVRGIKQRVNEVNQKLITSFFQCIRKLQLFIQYLANSLGGLIQTEKTSNTIAHKSSEIVEEKADFNHREFPMSESEVVSDSEDSEDDSRAETADALVNFGMFQQPEVLTNVTVSSSPKPSNMI